MTIRKAVLPAAGLGTRFLPASKAVPKEMVAVVDRPAVQYAVEELARAGVSDCLLITARGKEVMEDHFDRAPELERRLEEAGKHAQLEEVLKASSLARVHSVRQQEPLGFGHAVLLARDHVGDEPFFCLVPDEIVPDPGTEGEGLLESMLAVHQRLGGSVLAVSRVPKEKISAYGVVSGEEVMAQVIRVEDMTEKPSPQEARSDLASRGRYLFTPGIFKSLEQTRPGVGGEIQLTDAIRDLAQREEVYALVYDGPIYDVGSKLSYLQATVELALRRPDLGPDFVAYLKARLKEA